ncbi:CYTH and CHAD domain-containing protein [Mycobacteroides franklinii]|uniref:CHAD domain protein n=1 Tax=Mycobacteroides franklinii TaxID=948102 RepID=A0A4R8R8N2_9MYCO|nr:CYTH and CHAD domain-containing protein [Mycobacteroides franklinii]TDZ42468.1 CHAD domain protein [Mycobacteroides franklinii]TDZ52616.1 CHAD domain protein [Mycobacteroides franklinii]TDZ56023.1 CHAD domain protein [Mycobacteroides franklinii]TDZ62964.1 CHAD domain protein [Mycobacteroides franklinii]TDZ69361.1 CHAD domain protein [Mycobacteroides franklinii]
MPSQHVEVERKFDVTDATINPSFEGISAVARVEQQPQQNLDAVYFDTPDQRLAQHRITLRRRTGGTDAGWHLKLPAGPDTRTELRLPLTESDDVVPEELRDTVLAVVREDDLTPVARISTVRTVSRLIGADGEDLAEFCDDHVTAGDLSWREWELELSPGSGDSGGPDIALFDRITARLLDAGAAPAGHGSKLARVLDVPERERPKGKDSIQRALLEQLEQLQGWDRAVRVDTDDSVHQMRVTIRRIRSLLQSNPERFGLDTNPEPLDELRLLANILGVARDAEVLAQRYAAALTELPETLIRGPVRERLVDAARERYDNGLRRSLAAMRSHRYFRLLAALDELVASAGPASDTHHSEEGGTLDAAYRKVRRAARAAARAEGEYRDEALHRIRKSAKRLRYVASAEGAKKISQAAKDIQELLGEHQDSTVSRTYLGIQAAEAHGAGEDTFTYGVLYQREHDTAEATRHQVESTLRALRKAVRHKK